MAKTSTNFKILFGIVGAVVCCLCACTPIVYKTRPMCIADTPESNDDGVSIAYDINGVEQLQVQYYRALNNHIIIYGEADRIWRAEKTASSFYGHSNQIELGGGYYARYNNLQFNLLGGISTGLVKLNSKKQEGYARFGQNQFSLLPSGLFSGKTWAVGFGARLQYLSFRNASMFFTNTTYNEELALIRANESLWIIEPNFILKLGPPDVHFQVMLAGPSFISEQTFFQYSQGSLAIGFSVYPSRIARKYKNHAAK